MNRLRDGTHSPEYVKFLLALPNAPPGEMSMTAQELVASQRVRHPLFMKIAALSVQAEIDICEERRQERARVRPGK